MSFEASLLVGLFAVLLMVFWYNSIKVRERAILVAQEICTAQGLQFLDGTVALNRIGLFRSGGRLGIRRVYLFDYSGDGEQRQQGFVIMLSDRLETAGLASAIH